MIAAQLKTYESDLTPEQCRYLEFLIMPEGTPKAERPKEWLISSTRES